MNRNIVISFGLHIFLVIITAMSLPFLTKKPIDLPPIISVELIQITDKTNFFSFSLTFSIIFFALGAKGILVLSVI